MARTSSIGNLSAVISGNADLLAKELGRAKTIVNETTSSTAASFGKLDDRMARTGLQVIAGAHVFRLLHEEIKDVIANIENIPGVPGDTIVSVQRMRAEFTLAQNGIQQAAAAMAGFLSDGVTSIGALLGALSVRGGGDLFDGMADGLMALNNEMEKAVRLTPAYQERLRDAGDRLQELQQQLGRASVSQGERINALLREADGLRARASNFDANDLERSLKPRIAAEEKEVEAMRMKGELSKQIKVEMAGTSALYERQARATMSTRDAIADIEKELASRYNQKMPDLSGGLEGMDGKDLERALANWKKIRALETEHLELIKKNVDWANQLGSAFASTFDQAIQHGGRLGDFLRSLAQDIVGVFGKLAVVNPLINAMFGSSGMGVTGFKPLPSLFGFATGGDFTVGGSGGTDSQVVAFKATPGEAVSVRTPGQQAGGDGTTVVNHFNWSFGAGVTSGQVMALIPGIIEQTKAAVADSVMRGGGYRKAFA